MKRFRRQLGRVASGNPVALRLEKVFAKLDRDFPSASAWKTTYYKTALDSLAQRIEREGGREAIDKLCSSGCDRDALLWRLLAVTDEPDIQSLPGALRRKQRQTTNGLRRGASALGQIRGFQFGLDFSDPPLSFYFGRLRRDIEDAATILDVLFQYLLPHKGLFRQLPLVRLVHYVYTSTGRYHDDEVSELTDRIRPRKGRSYSVNAHSDWRQNIYKRAMDSGPTLSRVFRDELERCLIAALGAHQQTRVAAQADLSIVNRFRP